VARDLLEISIGGATGGWITHRIHSSRDGACRR
jgi:hypothetical protein